MTNKVKATKADMKKLHILFEAIMKVFPSNQNTLISVMLHNLAFDGSNTLNYNEKEEWKKMLDIKSAIEAMKTYNDYHLIAFLVEEIKMSFFGNEQIEAEETAEMNNLNNL